jgi:type VI secretion system protein
MQASLYDVLQGRFADGRPLQEVHDADHLVLSILGNLNRLFNTRRGSIYHLPDLGLPDISEIYRDIPDSIEKLQKAIVEAVERYEPRLRRVRVQPLAAEDGTSRLVFLLTAELLDRRRVRFQTTFSSTEAPEVHPWTRRE